MTRNVFAMTRPVMEARKRALVAYLQRNRDRAVPAIELAEHLQVCGSHETKRRLIRTIVGKLHDDGHRVCAECHPTSGGYWMARGTDEWRQYREARQKHARFTFAKVRQVQAKVTERISAQGKLFEDTECGMVKAGG